MEACVTVVDFDAADCGDAALEHLLKRVYVDEGYADRDASTASLSACSVRARGEVLAAVGEDRKVLLGTVTVVRPDSPARRFASAGEAEIHLLAVDPAWRGLRIGKALVEAAIARAQEHGASRILLWTQASMTAAQRLYARCDFQRVPELDFARAGRQFLVFERRD